MGAAAAAVDQVYLTPQQAAQYIGMTERALAEWRRTGGGPRYIRIGGPLGRVRYDRAEMDAWMRGQTQTSTSAESVAATI